MENLEKFQGCIDDVKIDLERARGENGHNRAAHALTGLLTLAVGLAEEILEQERKA